MKKWFGLIVLMVFFVGCQSGESIDQADIDAYDVNQIEDYVSEDDFIFRLVTEQEAYDESEEVNLFGEIEYVGEEEEVTILHASSAVFFLIEEKVRGYEIGSTVEDIGLSTTLEQGEVHREPYEKSGGYSQGEDQDYIDFVEDFMEREGFPRGFYEINARTDFTVEQENGASERIEMEATVDFKVNQ
ncbi:hypothetical protein SAMN05421734_101299 [Pelagirhabdus alkalitolerans]|uniref:Lipoprotein n=1 Tax=Pelagirhabdus alkalitolerans TaxID=1612202 RepID=A0A1G6GN19_9BACI|nr:hypothetical protein [Pelagirhabdus alkalitolerans]SDB83329.1 hypothetical protein SAMN05421734_101299 [Pelagirhabdus alkalitolerans]